MKKSNKKRNIIIGVVIVFVLAAIGGGMDNKDTTSNSTATPTAVAENTTNQSNNNQTEEPTKNPTSEPTQEPTQEPTPEPTPEVKTYAASTYKIGSDMPAGEYVLIVDGFSGYFEINKNSDGDFDSIIANDNFTTNSIVKVKKGQYLKITGAYAVSLDQAGKLDTTKQGMFKVGTHLKAGEYKLEVDEDSSIGYGYVEVASDSTHTLDAIKSNDNFQGTKYITVKKGQYIKIVGAHIVSK